MDEAYTDQFTVETWAKTQAVNIIKKELDAELPKEIKRETIKVLSRYIEDLEVVQKVYDYFMYLIFSDSTAKPIQAIATPLGLVAGYEGTDAILFGIEILKRTNGELFTIEERKDGEEVSHFIFPKYKLNKLTKQEIDNLQFLPPMQVIPRKWNNNTDGGWLTEKAHIILGKSLGKHKEFQAYDAINKLQEVALQIDPTTYLFEKDTNHNMKKKPFLRVIKEYLGKKFFFVWQYDTRGRMYSSGYHLNIQNNEYGKALLELAHKEKVTNLDNLYIAIANHAGKDKLNWQERIDWAKAQNGDFSSVEWKEPMLGRKAVKALADTLAGKATGYMMQLDSTASGLQIMAALSGCKETAKYTNLSSEDKRYDIYTEVTNNISELLGGSPLPRKKVKPCVMTHYYNSLQTPKTMLNKQEVKAFYETLNGMLPGAEEIMAVVNNCWNYWGTEHSWTMPDGHKVIVPVVEPRDYVITDPELGKIPFRTYLKLPSKNFRSLVPNIIHSIDGYIAREMIRRCNFPMLPIHDCFLANPNHLQEIANTYRNVIAEIADMNLLQDILREITGNRNFIYRKRGNISKDILNSKYALS